MGTGILDTANCMVRDFDDLPPPACECGVAELGGADGACLEASVGPLGHRVLGRRHAEEEAFQRCAEESAAAGEA